jgi:hypothetical protein
VRGIRSAAVAVLLALPGCAGTMRGPPPGAVEQVSFRTADGRPAAIMRSGGADLYYLYVPNTAWTALRLPTLSGLSGLTAAGATTFGPEAILLLRGAEPGCPARFKLLAVHLPQVRSVALLRCDGDFRLVPQRHRRSVVIYDAGATPPQYFSYAHGQLYGPTAHAAAGPRAAPSRLRSTVRRAAAPSAVNLDDLPAPPSSAAADPDQ